MRSRLPRGLRGLPAVLVLATALASGTALAAEPGDELGISLLTMSPGDHPFSRFGHDALLVQNRRTGSALVYNYGTFAFDSPWLIVDFLRGSFRYWLSVAPLDAVMLQYARQSRSIVAQELRLSPRERRGVADFLAWNARPENRYYRYDYYRDNCATRVRDVIDRAVSGRLRDVARGRARMTLRQHTLRLTADDRPLYLGLDLAMGDLIDQPITVWDEMFLPARVQEVVRLVRVPGPDGDQPLIRSEHTILDAHRAPPREA